MEGFYTAQVITPTALQLETTKVHDSNIHLRHRRQPAPEILAQILGD